MSSIARRPGDSCVLFLAVVIVVVDNAFHCVSILPRMGAISSSSPSIYHTCFRLGALFIWRGVASTNQIDSFHQYLFENGSLC